MTEPVVDPVEPTASVPEPVVKAAWAWGTLATFITTAVGALVALGILSSEQGTAIGGVVNYVSGNIELVGTVIVTIVSMVSGIISHQATAWVARRHVQPVPPDATAPRTHRAVR